MVLVLRLVLTAALSLALILLSLQWGAPWWLGGALALAGVAVAHWLYLQAVVQPLQRANHAYQHMRERLMLVQSFMDHAPVVIAVKDTDSRYLTANAQFERLHGITSRNLRGKLDGDFMPPDTAQTVRSNDQRVMQSGQTLTYIVPMAGQQGMRQMEALKFALYGEQHKILGVGLIATDVTDREVSNEKFARVFHASPNWIVITRLSDGVVIDANEGFEHTSGHTREAAIGHPIGDLNIWVNPAQRTAIVRALMRQGRVIDAKAQIRRKDGEVRDCVANAALISLDGQHKSHAVWIARDVTEENATHEQFVAAFRLTPDFMSISRVKDGRYVEVNGAFERFTGYRRDEVIGKTSVEIGLWHNPAQRVALVEILERLGEVRDFAVQLCDRHGRVRDGLGYGALFETRGERYMIAMMRDVTDALQAERALRESEARFANLFEMSPLPTSYCFDTDNYTATYRNAAFYSTFGYLRQTPEAISLHEAGFWVRPEDAARARQMRLDAVPIDNWVVELRHASGRHMWVSVFARVIVEPQRKIVITTSFDITEQRLTQHKVEDLNTRLEDRVQERTLQLESTNAELSQAMRTLEQARDSLVQSEKLASLGALVAGIAHELNTPIGNGLTVASTLQERVRSFASIAKQPMARSALDQFISEAEDAADLLTRSLGRAAALVSSFKQVAVDQTSSQRRNFDLSHLLDEVVMTISPAIRLAQSELVTTVAPGLTFDSYPGPLVQVLTHLVNNALVHAFAPGQQGRITIEAGPLEAGLVELTVRDNGQGIAPAHTKRIFDPFFTTRLGQGGSGLGLHVVHNIVTSVLGGRIDVHTTVGEGTQFVLQLPVSAPRVVNQE